MNDLSQHKDHIVHQSTKISYDFWHSTSHAPSQILILLNGYQRDRSDFRAFRKRLHQSQNSLISIAIDNRGTGESQSEEAFNMQDMAEDALKIGTEICKRYNIKGFFILGISMGGMIAQTMVTIQTQQPKYSEILGILLVSTTAGGELLIRSEKSTQRKDVVDLNNFETVLEQMKLYFGSKALQTSPLLIEILAKNILKSNQNRIKPNYQRNATQAFQGIQALNIINKKNIPLLLISGTEDHIIPLENSIKIKELVPNASLITYSQVGHLILIEEPEQFTLAVSSFLKQHKKE